jgi:hypothetical protein
MAHLYWIRHPEHSDMLTQGYIGVSKDVKNRWRYHKKCKQNNHLVNAIALHGWDNLVKQIIIEADMDYCLGVETKLRPSDKIGWNIVKGGGLPPSTPWNKGIPVDPERIKKMNAIRLSMPNHNLGKKLSEEVKRKMGAPKIGRKQTQEHIEKCRIAKIGKKQDLSTCPHCKKVGGAWTMPRWHFDNCKFKGAA